MRQRHARRLHVPVQPFPPEGWFAGKREILFHLKYFSFCFQVVGGLSLKLKSPFAGKKQVVIWRLAFAGRVLAPRFEWENLEGAFLQNTRVLPHLGEGVLQTWRWCPTLFLCSHERRPLELVITPGDKITSVHFVAERWARRIFHESCRYCGGPSYVLLKDKHQSFPSSPPRKGLEQACLSRISHTGFLLLQ